MPDNDIYMPLYVGAESKKNGDGDDLNLGYVLDNTGDNISKLNASFCELTGLYWAWKNLDSDYIGLVHYRRYFAVRRGKDPWDCVLTYKDIVSYLGKIKVFVPSKRKYYIETLYSHYKHTHYSSQLDATRKIIMEKYPNYLNCYDRVLNQRYGYMFNMMIMKKEFLNEYCTWLFDILFELRKRFDMPGLSAFQGRFYGRVSEIIFNVWLEYQIDNGKIKKDEVKELPFIYMEKINWWKKGMAFLKAKFLNQKYKGSF